MKRFALLLALAGSTAMAQEMSPRTVAAAPSMPGSAAAGIGQAFGADLPGELTARDIASLVLPRATASLATLSGLKRWDKQHFVSLVCVAPDAAAQIEALRRSDGKASCDIGAGTTLGLGIIKLDLDGRPGLVAEPLSWQGGPKSPIATNWEHTNLFGPYGINHWKDKTNAQAKEEVAMPDQLLGLDMGKYALNSKTRAFGIRSSMDERYTGGAAHFEFLSLFAVVGGELRVVFSEPVRYKKFVQRADGKYDEWSGANSVSVGGGKTDGFADLVVRSPKGWSKTFKWDASSMRYRAH